jgi:hypothetical protein
MIVGVSKSNVKNKRFMAEIKSEDGKIRRYHFGYNGAYTYLDGASDAVRDAYRKRHYANPTERRLIDNLVASPALLSWYLIWGESRSINENIKTLNRLWKARG